MEKIYNVTDFAEMIGKSVKTLQRWDREGILVAYRSPSKRRYYTHTQYLEYIGETKKSDKVNAVYARVSTKNQKDDLENQLQFMKTFCEKEGIPISLVYSDYGSGLNYRRKNWNRLIDDCFDGKISKIYISYEDRFIRFGYDWICDLLKRLCGVDIICVKSVVTSPEEELVKDLVSIIHGFSCRIYGLKKYKSKIEREFQK